MTWIILAVFYLIGYYYSVDFAKSVNEDANYPVGWRTYFMCLLWPIFWGAIVTYIIIDKIKK